jgi:hypothetical protein
LLLFGLYLASLIKLHYLLDLTLPIKVQINLLKDKHL